MLTKGEIDLEQITGPRWSIVVGAYVKNMGEAVEVAALVREALRWVDRTNTHGVIAANEIKIVPTNALDSAALYSIYGDNATALQRIAAIEPVKLAPIIKMMNDHERHRRRRRWWPFGGRRQRRR